MEQGLTRAWSNLNTSQELIKYTILTQNCKLFSLMK